MQIDRTTLTNIAPPSANLTEQERLQVEEQVNAANKANVIEGRKIKQTMDKDDFLTLLVTQLKNQDPSAPLEDKQFIAQMAQFSQLEQMNNLTGEFQKLSAMMTAGNAVNVLGKQVEISKGNEVVTGTVTQVTSGLYPQVLVNGQYYDYKDVTSVSQAQ
jgi:flagellar basal-body rod modification protein FlgD